jgi:hypothetical protein
MDPIDYLGCTVAILIDVSERVLHLVRCDDPARTERRAASALVISRNRFFTVLTCPGIAKYRLPR